MSRHTAIEPQRPTSRVEFAMAVAGRMDEDAEHGSIDGMGWWHS